MNDFKLKTELFFGSRALERLEQMPYRDIFIITDGFLESSGMVAKMAQHLPAGARYQTYSNVKPDPSQELVDEGVAAVEAARPDMVIAFGGGSCIDAAKAVLYTCCGRGMAKPYFLAIPTTAGTGSEVTNFAVITRGENKVVLIDDLLAPDGALLEADFTRSVPARITADTGMDVLTHAIEAYVSQDATAFTDAMAVKAVRTVLSDLPAVYRDGMSNAGLGVNHSLAHALGGRFHVAHGRLNAVLLPYVMAFHMADRKYREPYERLAGELGMAGADELLHAVLDLRQTLDIEHSLSGIERIDALEFERAISDMAEAAMHDRCTPPNVRPVSKQDLVNLYRDAFRGLSF